VWLRRWSRRWASGEVTTGRRRRWPKGETPRIVRAIVTGLALTLPVVAALGATPGHESRGGVDQQARWDGGHSTLAPDAGAGLPPCSGGVGYIVGDERWMLVADGGFVRCERPPPTLADDTGLFDLDRKFSREPFVHKPKGVRP